MRIPAIIRRVLSGALVCGLTVPLAAQSAARRAEIPAGYAAVREADLRRDVGELASPAMRGREGGTRDELRAAMWIAERYRRIGLQPAHAAHPVVPLAQVVAVLNGDMIGRTHPDSASLLGTHPPHRNSGGLVAMALRADALTGRFVLDTVWDRPTHPEGWYCRTGGTSGATTCRTSAAACRRLSAALGAGCMFR